LAGFTESAEFFCGGFRPKTPDENCRLVQNRSRHDFGDHSDVQRTAGASRNLAAISPENSAEHEVIVVDAGSSDGTCGIAQASGARVINSPRKQRAAQMNLGVKAAKGEFASISATADTWLAEESLSKIKTVLNNPKYVGGGFHSQISFAFTFLRNDLLCFAIALPRISAVSRISASRPA